MGAAAPVFIGESMNLHEAKKRLREYAKQNPMKRQFVPVDDSGRLAGSKRQ